jgi:hypothetical protein
VQENEDRPRRREGESGASLLRVLSIAALSSGETMPIWSAASGKTYRVQSKDSLETAWQDLSIGISITGTQGSASDSTAPASSNRFYRVVVLP